MRFKVAGLGGVFRGQIWMPPASPCYSSPRRIYQKKLGKATTWRGGLPRRHRSTIFSSVYDKLKECKADVLVTHEAPSIHAKGFECLDILADQLGVNISFMLISMKVRITVSSTDLLREDWSEEELST